MKKNKLLYMLFGAMLILVIACDPIEKRNELDPAMTEEQLRSHMDVKLDGNTANVSTDADNVIPYWKTSAGAQSNLHSTSFYFPMKNKYTISLTAFGGNQAVTVTKEVEVAENDPEYFTDPMWQLLTNDTEGKTWVWASDIPGGVIWGNGGYLIHRAPASDWWPNTITSIVDQGGHASDEITFDLSKSMNFKVATERTIGAVPGNGSGSFDMKLGQANQVKDADGKIWSYGKLILSNHSIPLGFEPNTDGNPLHYTFDILKLTEDELVLAFPEPKVTDAWGTTWYYMFKRKGFTY